MAIKSTIKGGMDGEHPHGSPRGKKFINGKGFRDEQSVTNSTPVVDSEAHVRLGSELYDREGFERDDNAPYEHGDDPHGANDMTADYGDNEPFETPKY